MKLRVALGCLVVLTAGGMLVRYAPDIRREVTHRLGIDGVATPYTTLALSRPYAAVRTLMPGEPVRVTLTNHSGGGRSYVMTSHVGDQTFGSAVVWLDDGASTEVWLSTHGAARGDMVVVSLAGLPQELRVPVGVRP